MAIYKGDKRAVIYRGDYRPAELYKGAEKAAGYTVETVSGRSAKVDDTYNDRLDISVQGRHTQETQAERKVDFVGTAEFVANEESYLGAAVFEGRHEQKKYTGRNLIDFGILKQETPLELINKSGTAIAHNFDSLLNRTDMPWVTVAFHCIAENVTPPDDSVTGNKGRFGIEPTFTKAEGGTFYLGAWATATGWIASGKPREFWCVWTLQMPNVTMCTGANGYLQKIGADYLRIDDVFIGEVKAAYNSTIHQRNPFDSIIPAQFEPFVGGKPSPSPSYPQPIEAVQEERVEVRGVNSFDLSDAYTDSYKTKKSGIVAYNLQCEVLEDRIRLYGTPSNTNKAMDFRFLWTSKNAIENGYGFTAFFKDNVGNIESSTSFRYAGTTDPSLVISLRTTTSAQYIDLDIYPFFYADGKRPTAYEPFHSPSSISHSLTLYGDGTTNDSFDMVTGKYTKWWEKISLPVSEMNNHEDYAGWKWRTGTAKIHDLFPNVNGTFAGATKWFCNYCREGININTMGANDIVFLAAGVIFPERKQSEIISAHSDLVFEIVYKLPAAEVSYLDPSTVELIDGTNILTTQPSATGTVVLDPLKPSPLYPTEIKGTEGAEVEVEGVNLFPYNGTYDVNVDYVKPNNSVWNPIELSAGIYTLSIFGDDSFRHYNSSIPFRDKTGAVFAWTRLHTIGTNSYVFSIDKDVAQLAVYINQKVTGVSIMIERGDKASPYVPYREGSEQTLPFTLYGANGIFDTCEPCVLVDGVERCRVTRRWRREIVSPNLSWAVAERRNGFIRFYAPFTGMSMEGDVCVLSTIAEGVKFSDITSMRLHGVSNYTGSSRLYFCVSDSYDLDSFKAMLSNDKPEIVYRLAEPSVEYYDPLPLSTIPHCTIINSSADFTAAVKRVER